jgi:hypothetical protein
MGQTPLRRYSPARQHSTVRSPYNLALRRLALDSMAAFLMPSPVRASPLMISMATRSALSNNQTGIQFLGLVTDDHSALISGLLFHLVGPEPAGFAVDNIRFGVGEEVVPPGCAWPHRRCRTSGPHNGRWWPARLVATAAEDCLNIPTQLSRVVCGSQRCSCRLTLRQIAQSRRIGAFGRLVPDG